VGPPTLVIQASSGFLKVAVRHSCVSNSTGYPSYDVPVADMLAHSPPLPLTIWYTNDGNREMTAEDEEGALHALSQRDRAHCIALWMPAPNLGKFIMTMNSQSWTVFVLSLGQEILQAKSFPEDFEHPIYATCGQLGIQLDLRSFVNL
jgi:hypothetical protein